MALTRAGGTTVYARGVPENTIVRATLEDNELTNLTLVLSPAMYPQTHDKQPVVGYEDPTFMPASTNPFGREDALLCTQVFPSNERPGKVETNLVYVALDGSGAPASVRPILTPAMLVDAGVADVAYMAKEAELIRHDGREYLLFEYNSVHGDEPKASHIGICEILDGKCACLRRFWTAADDGSAHVSTCGSPLVRIKGGSLLFFNRRRDSPDAMVWGIACALVHPSNWDAIAGMAPLWLQPDLLIGPPDGTTVADKGRSGAGQLINFGSCVSLLPDNTIEVLSHVRDDRPYRTVLAFC